MIPNIFLINAYTFPVFAIAKNLALQLRTHNTFSDFGQIAWAIFSARINAV